MVDGRGEYFYRAITRENASGISVPLIISPLFAILDRIRQNT